MKSPSRLRHGHARKSGKSGEYVAWMKMRSRCNNPHVPAFSDYGGRGVLVCERWDTFENFLADMGKRPSARHSVDRIDNSRGYSPDNCRWASSKEQNRNRRDNRILEVNGRLAPLAEHCETLGMNYKLVHRRLQRGASIEIAFSKERAAYGSIHCARPK